MVDLHLNLFWRVLFSLLFFVCCCPLASFIWEAKVPSKLKAFAWNTNDLWQHRPWKALSPGHVCYVAAKVNLMSIFSFIVQWLGDCGVSCLEYGWEMSVSSFDLLSTMYVDLGGDKDAVWLWRCVIFGALWCIWTERIARTFRDQALSFPLLKERIQFLASLWSSALGAFQVVLVTDRAGIGEWCSMSCFFWMLYFATLHVVFVLVLYSFSFVFSLLFFYWWTACPPALYLFLLSNKFFLIEKLKIK